MLSKNERKSLKTVKFQEKIEKKLSEQELQYIGCPKIDNFSSCLDNILKFVEINNSEKNEEKELIKDKINDRNIEINFIMYFVIEVGKT